MLPPPPRSTLFPYTTLFRSVKYAVNDVAAPVATTAVGPVTFVTTGGRLFTVTGVLPVPVAPSGSVTVTLIVYVDRKSTRLNSSHPSISYAVFCLKKKNEHPQ